MIAPTICAHLLKAAHALREIVRHDCNIVLGQGTHGYYIFDRQTLLSYSFVKKYLLGPVYMEGGYSG